MHKPYFAEVTQALCLRDPLFDLVNGNITGSKSQMFLFEVKTRAAAVTRIQARKDTVTISLITNDTTDESCMAKNNFLGDSKKMII